MYRGEGPVPERRNGIEAEKKIKKTYLELERKLIRGDERGSRHIVIITGI